MATLILSQSTEGTSLATDLALEQFLSTVERRAFLMARAALGDQEDALDVVQDAMMLLVRKYRNRPEDEWRRLFYTILNNRVRDIIRKRSIRNRFTGWLSTPFKSEEEQEDPFQQVADRISNNPAHEVGRQESMEALGQAVADLPGRQQEAFMLRCWEGLSTAETATIMKCSEGSVKTHYSRALQFLQGKLEAHRDD